ncbi:hypothetical protein LIA77_08800 [Sarocladium implicatum]|nr:hypothetical protein LIA77_08800 [Sarocladium implicatum]
MNHAWVPSSFPTLSYEGRDRISPQMGWVRLTIRSDKQHSARRNYYAKLEFILSNGEETSFDEVGEAHPCMGPGPLRTMAIHEPDGTGSVYHFDWRLSAANLVDDQMRKDARAKGEYRIDHPVIFRFAVAFYDPKAEELGILHGGPNEVYIDVPIAISVHLKKPKSKAKAKN